MDTMGTTDHTLTVFNAVNADVRTDLVGLVNVSISLVSSDTNTFPKYVVRRGTHLWVACSEEEARAALREMNRRYVGIAIETYPGQAGEYGFDAPAPPAATPNARMFLGGLSDLFAGLVSIARAVGVETEFARPSARGDVYDTGVLTWGWGDLLETFRVTWDGLEYSATSAVTEGDQAPEVVVTRTADVDAVRRLVARVIADVTR